MSTIIIAKNVSASSILIEDMGKSIDALSSLDLTELFDVAEIVDSDDLAYYVGIGDIVLNDGSIDLSIDDALSHLHRETKWEDDKEIDQATLDAFLGSTAVISIDILHDSTSVVENVRELNFTGGVDVVDDGLGKATIDIQGGGTSAVDKKAGIVSLALDNTSKDILFDSSFEDTNFTISVSLINTVDSIPAVYSYIVSSKLVSGFTVDFSGYIDSNNYSLEWSAIKHNIIGKSGIAAIPNDATSMNLIFSSPFANSGYSISIAILNTVDIIPAVYSYITSAKSTTGFTVIFSGYIDSSNYYLEWIAVPG